MMYLVMVARPTKATLQPRTFCIGATVDKTIADKLAADRGGYVVSTLDGVTPCH